MRCRSCGTTNAAQAKFCHECGKALAEAPRVEEFSEQITVTHRRPEWVADDPNMNTQIRKKIELAQEGLSGTRRFVTILFADIQGFTSLCERMDPEQVTELMNRYLGRLGKIVYEFEGYVDKYIGDCIMALFGAPIAHDNDPELAIRSAVKMLQALGELNAETGNKLSIRIGINAGMVVAGGVGNSLKLEFTVMGDAVNLAQRLQSAAQPGQIVVGKSVARAARGFFDFEPLDLKSVKGKSEPVEAFIVRGIKGARESQSRGLTENQTKLIGRKETLQSLRPILRSIKEDVSQHFVLTGPAGIGKSRLKWELRSALKNQGLEWCEVTCNSLKAHIPLAPFRDLLGTMVRESKDVQRWLEQVEAASFDSHEKKLSLLLSLKSILHQRAKAKYTVYFFDDLQWADSVTVEALQYLAAGSSHFILAGATRSAERIALKGFHLISLLPLSESESIELTCALLKSQTIPSELKEFIKSQCQGNPLFIEETVRALVERKTLLSSPEKGWTLAGPIALGVVSEGLQSTVLARIDQLPMPDRDVLEAASVMGRKFSYKLLKELLTGHPHLDESLQFLRQKELIFEFEVKEGEIEYIFNQNITREITYQSILRKKQKAMHRDVAQVFEMLLRKNEISRGAESFELLAHHFKEAEVYDRWVHYFLASVEFKNLSAAIEQLQDALKQKIVSEARQLVILKLIDLQSKRGDFVALQSFIVEHLAEFSGDLRSQILLRAGEVESKLQHFDVAASYYDDAASGTQELVTTVRILKGKANLKIQAGQTDAALKLFEEALSQVQKISDSVLAAEILNDLCVVQIKLQKFKDAESTLRKALPLAIGARGQSLRTKLLINQGAVNICLGSWDQALESFQKAIESADVDGNLFDQMKALHNAAVAAVQLQKNEWAKTWLDKSNWLAGELKNSQQLDLNQGYLVYLNERAAGVPETEARAKLELRCRQANGGKQS